MEPQSFETPDGLQLIVEIPAGTVRVDATETTRTDLEIEGERDPDDISVRLDPTSGGGHRLHLEYRGRRFARWTGRDLEVSVRVPLETAVEVSTGSADLQVHGLVRSIQFRTGSGDLSFDNAEGDVTMKVASGDVDGTWVGGSLTMSGASGDVHVHAVDGDLTVRTASGDVDVERVGGSAVLATVSGDVQLGSLSSGDAHIRSVSGDVEIGVAQGTRVFLDLMATTGEATSELSMDPGAGAGDADLALHVGTVSGDIRVRRAPALDQA